MYRIQYGFPYLSFLTILHLATGAQREANDFAQVQSTGSRSQWRSSPVGFIQYYILLFNLLSICFMCVDLVNSLSRTRMPSELYRQFLIEQRAISICYLCFCIILHYSLDMLAILKRIWFYIKFISEFNGLMPRILSFSSKCDINSL